MAHDRSARFGKSVTQTPAFVGPGSYDVCEPTNFPKNIECPYPFLSGTARKTFQLSKDSGKYPGPGSYNPREPKRHVPESTLSFCGGVSIDFTDIRLKPKIYEGPGPTSYSLSDDLFKSIKPKLRSHPGTWRGPAGRLWLGAPPRSLIVDPSNNDTNGYRISERGILVKNPPIESKSIDFYDVPREETNTVTLRYKGNFWSLMSGRDDKTIEVTPGPGAYELNGSTDMNRMRNEAFRSMKRAASRQYRYLDKLWAQKLSENYPAPNSYDPPKGPFDVGSACECGKYVVEPPAFGHSAKRFETEGLNDAPGPGAYDPSAGKCLPCSMISAPFGAWDSRFKKSTSDSKPGPGAYDLTRDDLANKLFSLCKRRYARTKVQLRSKDEAELIEPSDEFSIIDDTEEPKKSRVHHAVFKSKTSRFKETKQAETPAPGDYDVTKSFKASQDSCHGAQQSLTSSFSSKSARFPRLPYGVDLDVPGPGIYNLTGDIALNIKGGVIGDANERRKRLDTIPGPQKYCLHPCIASSVVRKSYNVTLGRPKILCEQEKFRNPWTKRCRGKKTLRWFSQPVTKRNICWNE